MASKLNVKKLDKFFKSTDSETSEDIKHIVRECVATYLFAENTNTRCNDVLKDLGFLSNKEEKPEALNS